MDFGEPIATSPKETDAQSHSVEVTRRKPCGPRSATPRPRWTQMLGAAMLPLISWSAAGPGSRGPGIALEVV